MNKTYDLQDEVQSIGLVMLPDVTTDEAKACNEARKFIGSFYTVYSTLVNDTTIQVVCTNRKNFYFELQQ